MRTLRIFPAGTRNTQQYGLVQKEKKRKRKINVRGRAGIEPATSPTRTENHTSRPTARVPVKVASSEDRTRDLALTRRMLCQLSYRGENRANATHAGAAGGCAKASKKSLHQCCCCSLDLGTSNPSLAVAEGFPCSVSGLMAVPLSLVTHEARTSVQAPLANHSLERERPSTAQAAALSDQRSPGGYTHSASRVTGRSPAPKRPWRRKLFHPQPRACRQVYGLGPGGRCKKGP